MPAGCARCGCARRDVPPLAGCARWQGQHRKTKTKGSRSQDSRCNRVVDLPWSRGDSTPRAPAYCTSHKETQNTRGGSVYRIPVTRLFLHTEPAVPRCITPDLSAWACRPRPRMRSPRSRCRLARRPPSSARALRSAHYHPCARYPPFVRAISSRRCPRGPDPDAREIDPDAPEIDPGAREVDPDAPEIDPDAEPRVARARG